MVADEEDTGSKGVPAIDVRDISRWITDLAIHLRSRNRNHLGLKPHGLADPAANAASRAEYAKAVEIWETRNDTCIAKIHEAVQGNSEALEIFEQYLAEKEALDANDANKKELAEELLGKLKARFSHEIQAEKSVESTKFTNFILDPSAPVSSGIDRLNGITLKLASYNLPVSPEAKLAKLVEAMNIPELSQLWFAVTLIPNATWELVTGACKAYDSAQEQIKKRAGESVHLTMEERSQQIVCSHCGKPGHTQDKCFLKRKKQQTQRLKTAGRRQAREKGQGRQIPGDASYDGCHDCGSMDHLSKKCPQKKAKKPHGSSRKGQWKDQQQTSDFRKYLRKGERRAEKSSDSEESSVDQEDVPWKRRKSKPRHGSHMIQQEEVLTSEHYDEFIFWDSCATKKLFILRSSMTTLGTGSFGAWKDIVICKAIIHFERSILSGYLQLIMNQLQLD